MLENSVWLLRYSLATIAFWFVEYFFRINGDNLNLLPLRSSYCLNQLLWRFTALHKLISIV